MGARARAKNAEPGLEPVIRNLLWRRGRPRPPTVKGYQHQGFSCFFFFRPMATAVTPLPKRAKKEQNGQPRSAFSSQAATKWPPLQQSPGFPTIIAQTR